MLNLCDTGNILQIKDCWEDKIILIVCVFNHYCLCAGWRSDLKISQITVRVLLANSIGFLHIYSNKSGGGYSWILLGVF